MTEVNIRRGANRIYVVLTVVWCFVVLLLPFELRRREFEVEMQAPTAYYNTCTNTCTSAALRRPLYDSLGNKPSGKSYEECSDEFHRDLDEVAARNTYVAFMGGYLGLLWLPVAMVIPPAILYGGLLLLSKVGGWIIAGFRS